VRDALLLGGACPGPLARYRELFDEGRVDGDMVVAGNRLLVPAG
jgi:hypothetical protein